MVGTQYQAEVPSCLCLYKDGEKGNCCVSFLHTCAAIFFNVIVQDHSSCNLTVTHAFQCMKMKMSYYGAQVHCQRTRLGVSCRKRCRGQQVKKQDATNRAHMFETMNRSVI